MNVEGAFPAMARMRRRKADDNGAHVRFGQPERDMALEHAALAPVIERERLIAEIRARPFSCDHQNTALSLPIASQNEGSQRAVGFTRPHSVQVDPRLDFDAPCRETLGLTPVEVSQRRCSGPRRFAGRRRWRIARRQRRRGLLRRGTDVDRAQGRFIRLDGFSDAAFASYRLECARD